jgi:uridine phosphorylase
MQEEVLSGDLVIASGAIRMDGTSREYAPPEYPAVGDYEILKALEEAADNLGMRHHVGVVHCKDAFYGQHNPELLPQSRVLLSKWDAWLKMGCLASEMESSTLFIVGAYRKVRAGTVLLVMANQTRAAKGLSNPIVHDTDGAIRTAVEAVRILIREDREKEKND